MACAAFFRRSRRSILAEAPGLRLNVEAPAMRSAGIGETASLVVASASAWALRP
ncbi:MAG: hypothetical protein AB7O45_06780 [Alphaproteobacteria bacterium]